MNRGLFAIVAISASTIASLTAAACDHGTQARIIRTNDLYYRWVVDYTNASGNTFDMRKSDIFLATRDRPNPEVDDQKIPS